MLVLGISRTQMMGGNDEKPTEAMTKYAKASLKIMRTLRCQTRLQAEGAVRERKLILGSSLA